MFDRSFTVIAEERRGETWYSVEALTRFKSTGESHKRVIASYKSKVAAQAKRLELTKALSRGEQ